MDKEIGIDDYDIMLSIDRFDHVCAFAHVTPIYCMKCKNQSKRFIRLTGSRYGDAGYVTCDHCSESIHLIDNDNVVYFLEMHTTSSPQKMYRFEFRDLYHLQNEKFQKIKEKTGYDIVKLYKFRTKPYIFFNKVLEEIAEKTDIDLNDGIELVSGTHEKIKRFPPIVNQWFNLLRQLDIDL